MNRQEQLDRQWHDTGYEDMGIGFKHEPTDPRTDGIPYDLSKPIAPSDDMGGLVDHEWIRKNQYESDLLAPARGCLIGCILGMIIWALIFWSAYEWLK
jgi:hypothetical protein